VGRLLTAASRHPADSQRAVRGDVLGDDSAAALDRDVGDLDVTAD
jgi:hypothetical protein